MIFIELQDVAAGTGKWDKVTRSVSVNERIDETRGDTRGRELKRYERKILKND